MHVIHVDDDKTVLRTVRRELSPRGMRVTWCETAESALAVAPVADADVILLDYQLRDTDGISLGQALRSRGVTAPFVLYSGVAGEAERIRAHRALFAAVTDKSMSLAELAEILHKLAKLYRTPPKPAKAGARQSLILDLKTSELSDGSGLRVLLKGQSLAVVTHLAQHGFLRRWDIPEYIYGEAIPPEGRLREAMENRIKLTIHRLSKCLGSFSALLDTSDGKVRLTAPINIAGSGTFVRVEARVRKSG